TRFTTRAPPRLRCRTPPPRPPRTVRCRSPPRSRATVLGCSPRRIAVAPTTNLRPVISLTTRAGTFLFCPTASAQHDSVIHHLGLHFSHEPLIDAVVGLTAISLNSSPATADQARASSPSSQGSPASARSSAPSYRWAESSCFSV